MDGVYKLLLNPLSKPKYNHILARKGRDAQSRCHLFPNTLNNSAAESVSLLSDGLHRC